MVSDWVLRVESLWWGSVPRERDPITSSTSVRVCLWTRKRALTGCWNCWCLNLGLPLYQNCEKLIFIVCKPPTQFLLFLFSSPNGLNTLYLLTFTRFIFAFLLVNRLSDGTVYVWVTRNMIKFGLNIAFKCFFKSVSLRIV